MSADDVSGDAPSELPQEPTPGGGGMIELSLQRIVIQDSTDRQHIYLCEREGERGFPILIGSNEALEIHRVVHGVETGRPLTHELVHKTIQGLQANLKRVDIVSLRKNTYYAQLVLGEGLPEEEELEPTLAADPERFVLVDARPSDAIALALRARCPIVVAEDVLAEASQE